MECPFGLFDIAPGRCFQHHLAALLESVGKGDLLAFLVAKQFQFLAAIEVEGASLNAARGVGVVGIFAFFELAGGHARCVSEGVVETQCISQYHGNGSDSAIVDEKADDCRFGGQGGAAGQG